MVQVSARAPLEPSEANAALVRSRTRWAAPLGRVLMRPWLRAAHVVGREHLEQGPVLVLMNHGCPIDPMIFGCATEEPIQWLVTAPALDKRYGRSRWLAAFGQVPKRKLEAETKAMRTLKAWSKLGLSVGVFPEGQFDWEGRPQPLQPGLSQLVRYLDLPVVTVRVENGDRFWPAWAPAPRSSEVRFTLSAPRRFEPGEDIAAAVADAIRVEPDEAKRYPVTGGRLAIGLDRLLGRCPECGLARLHATGCTLSCGCGARWTVHPDNRLTGTRAMSIGEALAAVRGHLEAGWSTGIRLTSVGTVQIRDLTGPEERLVAEGRLELVDGVLKVDRWKLELDQVLARTRDWPHRIVLKSRRTRVGVDMASDSRALWMYALDRACPPADHAR